VKRSEESFSGFKGEVFEGFGIWIEALGISIWVWVFKSMCPTEFSSSLFRRVLLLIDSTLDLSKESVVLWLHSYYFSSFFLSIVLNQ